MSKPSANLPKRTGFFVFVTLLLPFAAVWAFCIGLNLLPHHALKGSAVLWVAAKMALCAWKRVRFLTAAFRALNREQRRRLGWLLVRGLFVVAASVANLNLMIALCWKEPPLWQAEFFYWAVGLVGASVLWLTGIDLLKHCCAAGREAGTP